MILSNGLFMNSPSGLAGNWAGSCMGCTMRSSAFPQHIQYICILPNSNCNSNHCFKETMKISTNSRDHMKKKLISLLKTRDSELPSTFIYIVIEHSNWPKKSAFRFAKVNLVFLILINLLLIKYVNSI